MSDKQDEMWAALEAYQPTADKDGHGDAWRVMLKERTKAAWAAWADSFAQTAIDAIKEVKP